MIYEPKEDSFLLERVVKQYAGGKRVLDVGSGSGIQAETALAAGAKSVFCVELDDESIEHLKIKGLEVVKSDLFERVNGKFDLIIFNPPYLPEDSREDKKSARATSGGKKGDEVIVKFLKSVSENLEKKGRILMVVSSLTPLERIRDVMIKKDLRRTVVAKEKIFMESLEVWEIRKT